MKNEHETVDNFKKMIEEGVTNLEIIEKNDHTLILQKFPDETVEFKIPKLLIRNQIAIQIWRKQQSIKQLTLFEALKVLGLQLNNIEIYLLSKKLVLINDHINQFKSRPKPKAGYASGFNPEN